MDNKALLNEIAKHASILENHIMRLEKKPELLHEIDVEVLSEKIKEIYTLINSLETGEQEKKEEILVVNEIQKVPLVKVEPEPEIPSPQAPIVNEHSSEPEMSSESGVGSSEHEEGSSESGVGSSEHEEGSSESEVGSSDLEEVVEQPPAPSPQPPAASEQPPAPNSQPTAISEQPTVTSPEPPVSEPKTTADLFSGPTTIADSFHDEKDNSIAANVHPQPVQDLKMAIGINDKFLFINELFKGDPGIYNEAIESLNRAGEIAAAEVNIESYRSEFGWADNSEAYHRLKKIVKAKYTN